MLHTGRRSLIERGDASHRFHRPELNGCGRWRRWLALLSLTLLVAQVPAAQAQDLLSWWNRDLLPIDLVAGDWIELEFTDISEEGAFTDSMRVEVLLAPADAPAWVLVEGATRGESDFFLIDFPLLRSGASPMDALLRLVRQQVDGTLVEEDLADHRDSRLVRRHLEDPFENPEITRRAAPDTTFAGQSLPREHVLLHELRVEERPMGPVTTVIRTELAAHAVVSPGIPVLGLLSATTRTVVTTEQRRAGKSRERRGAPPLESIRGLRCLGFGRGEPSRLPPETR